MKLGSSLFAVFVGAGMFAAPVFAQSGDSRQAQAHHAQEHADAALASLHLEHDPNAPVHVVMARKSYDGMRDLVSHGAAAADGVGTALVVSEIKAHMLSRIAERIHQREQRCGGFFAFATRAEAEAFVRSDRSAQALRSNALLAAYTIDNQATVSPWLPLVQHTNIYGTINTLSSYQNRYYTSPTGKTSAEWIRNTWQGLAGSRTDVTSELFACSTCSTQPSVILTIRGNELPNEIVVLGAHLDSINGSAGGSATQVAPGADDDASGIATLTEVLRIAMANGWKPKRTVKFMGYAAEEVGLRGSNAIAQAHKAAAANVVAVLQLDMTNYRSGTTADMRLVTDYSNVDMKTFLTNLFDTYLAPLGMTRGTYTCGYGCSDHASWTSAGYPSAMFFEAGTASGGYSPYIHTANDTLANMGNSAQNSAKFAQLGLAFLGEAAKTSGGGGGNIPPTANFTSSVSGLTASFTDTSTDSDGSIAGRRWNFGDNTSSTLANPSHTYGAAGSYNVTLNVTDNAGAAGSKTQAVTVGSSCGGTVLCNGVAVALPSQATNTTSANYTLAVPAGKTSVVFTISGGTGDADMYVRIGSAPTTSTYNCRPYTSGNTETCTFNAPAAGTYYVNVRAYSAYSGVSLKGTISP
jgi:bacterial leucyl aminopeptidase